MAVFSRKQSGSITLSGGTTSDTATVLSYDATSSILKVSFTHGTDRPNVSYVRVVKTDSTTLTFIRTASSHQIQINWELLEFSSGVTVQDLSIPIALPATHTIDARDLTKSFIIDNTTGGSAAFNQGDTTIARFNSSTEIELVSNAFVHAARELQIVEYDGCTVQELSSSLAATTLTSTTVAIPVAVDPTVTLIFGSMTTDDSGTTTGHDASLWRLALTDGSTLTLDRYLGTAFTFAWNLFVVEFTDGTTVQSGLVTITGTSSDVTITSIDTDLTATFLGTVTLGGFSHGRGDWATDDTRITAVKTSLPDDTTFRIERELTSNEVGIFWQAPTFSTAPAGDPAVLDVRTSTVAAEDREVNAVNDGTLGTI